MVEYSLGDYLMNKETRELFVVIDIYYSLFSEGKIAFYLAKNLKTHEPWVLRVDSSHFYNYQFLDKNCPVVKTLKVLYEKT